MKLLAKNRGKKSQVRIKSGTYSKTKLIEIEAP
ncbi:MAG: hypothetical protein BRC38_02640 [Cyanobacteria bacterium QH_6_48_35]|nr:MAG: hypothetical protein BRC34_01645 [Cyanobacteria bacterium QH_1_48_107]PSO59712.1 MAG: hypothetical protein BRC35_03385 [Cyanobacteria bacterium QH_10_48_56]PSO61441.1 MAG: hypothetical protein BRC39_08090 [Cyanobacteria bacterium QH_7_48_89]PSO67784.1 MAG: hypothetical protein BRC38_02640 [Cyanobacteria bacterium QH_6_48_35]PSP36288.1 MAG: hypothetical protein BRC57_02365 [Cyanobacteria bacterium QS_8_48_54]